MSILLTLLSPEKTEGVFGNHRNGHYLLLAIYHHRRVFGCLFTTISNGHYRNGHSPRLFASFKSSLAWIMSLLPQESRAITRSTYHRLLSTTAAIIVITIPVIILPSLFNNLPQPMRTSSLTGRQYMDDVLSCINPRRCQEIFRMKIWCVSFSMLRIGKEKWVMSFKVCCNWWKGRDVFVNNDSFSK